MMFDYDGVIVNSGEFFVRDFLEACRETGFDLSGEKEVMALFDNNVYEAMQDRGLDSDVIDKILQAYEKKAAEHIGQLEIFAGMDEVLRKIAQNNEIYIITSNVSGVTTAVLRKNGITCFADVIGADVEKSKVKKIQKLMRQYPDMMVYYVGDTAGDILEGKAAGARTIGVAWGWHGAEKLKAHRPDCLVYTPEELTGILGRQDGRECEVTFQPQRKKAKVIQLTTVLEAARQNNLPLEGPCSGKGTCGKCLVRFSGLISEPGEMEKELLGPQIEEGWRLACQAKVIGDVEIILGEKRIFHIVQGGKTRNYEFDPAFPAKLRRPDKICGVAVDIGTTSIVASLNDLINSGQELGTAACLNPQSQYGGDVITRITFAHEQEENVRKLQSAVVKGISGLIENLSQQHNVNTKDIYQLTVAGNTTMLHLLAGIDPVSLARAPYNPVFVDYQEMSAAELGITAAPAAVVGLLPSLSAFVGADILAGMIATGFHNLDEPSLFIDVGTNGEIVANVHGRLAATSSAAGPALEGMNIECGCRAEDGAISGVKINDNGELAITTIGSAGARGLCGSGLVELVAGLVKAGVILSNGRFADAEQLPPVLAGRLFDREGQKAFLVDCAGRVVLTQKDVRQVQLAKAAIAAAIDILFKRLEVELGSVEKIYIAGAFGYHLKPEVLRTIGLLPAGLDAGIEFVGNTAKEGARLCLLSRRALAEIKDLQKAIMPLELSYAPDFQDCFVEQMDFPLGR